MAMRDRDACGMPFPCSTLIGDGPGPGGRPRRADCADTERGSLKKQIISFRYRGVGFKHQNFVPKNSKMAKLARAVLFTVAGCLHIVVGDNVSASCQQESIVGYDSPNGCVRAKMKSSPLRVAYLDSQYVTQNQAAIARTKALGMNYIFDYSCESSATAVPEW
jgi:hypothetical protein